jgi:hypothetical protein
LGLGPVCERALMAGWTVAPADWVDQEPQLHGHELWDARGERNQILVASYPSAPAAGEIMQGAAPTLTNPYSFRDLQDWIQIECVWFVQSHGVDGTPLATDFYDGQDTITMWTFANLMTAVAGGVASTSFRATTDYPDDWTDYSDAAFSQAKIAVGDILGPWILADLQKAFNMLIWTRHYYEFTREGENNRKNGGATSEASWAAAKAAAETAYAGSTYTDGTCLVWSHGDYYVGLVGWQAILNRVYQYGTAVIPDDYAKSVDWYCYAKKETHPFFEVIEFDANGDDVIEDKMSLWRTEAKAASSGTEWVTDTKVAGGSLTAPAWMTEPTSGQEKCRGYIIDSAQLYCVARWNVANGFTFY